MTNNELLECLTERPCDVCKFHKEKGCTKWDCVFDQREQEPKTEWIPVSKRVPEIMCYVYLTCISKIDDREPWVCDGFYNPYYTEGKYTKWGNIPMLNCGDAEVIAWMKKDIPEPYKESEGKE